MLSGKINKALSFLSIDIVDTEEGTGEGGGFSEGNEEGLVDLSLRFDEDAAKEQEQASDGEDKSCYEL